MPKFIGVQNVEINLLSIQADFYSKFLCHQEIQNTSLRKKSVSSISMVSTTSSKDLKNISTRITSKM